MDTCYNASWTKKAYVRGYLILNLKIRKGTYDYNLWAFMISFLIVQWQFVKKKIETAFRQLFFLKLYLYF